MGVYVYLNHNPNKGQLFDSFDNAVIPFSLDGINKNIGNFLLCKQNWHITFCPNNVLMSIRQILFCWWSHF